MPLSMKIQPINARDAAEPPTRPLVVKSRIKRLFRISLADKTAGTGADESCFADQLVEPSLAKMVQNFLEESNEKPPPPPSGRHRCNCFNANGSEGSDTDPNGVDTSDLKGLVTCTNVTERNLLADTAKIVERNTAKGSRRKDDLRKAVADGLVAQGYDASLCVSKWEKTPSFLAGEYEYVDVITAGSRLILDVDFRSEFEIARSTKAYKSILQTLPYIFVGRPDRLARIVALVSEAARVSLKKKGMHFPPWRKAEYVKAKWLSPYTRLRLGPSPANPLAPIETIGSVGALDCRSDEKGGEGDCCGSMDDEPIFAVSDS